MKNIFIIVCALLVFHSCKEEVKEQIPPGILPQNKMISVLTDLQLVEATIQLNSMAISDSSRKIAEGYYKYVFDKNRITAIQFDSSFRYYSSRPKELSAVYDSVLARLSQRKAIADTTKQVMPDTIQRISR